MYAKIEEKKKAIEMRRAGKVYSEILEVVPVAKSTLSIWLREVGLAKAQKQRITRRRIAAQKIGAKAKHQYRIERQNLIWQTSKAEIGEITDRELFLIGTVLYWAEGSKEKTWKVGARLTFSNMDSGMAKVFLEWLKRVAKVPENMIVFDVYLHINHRSRSQEVMEYWRKVVGFKDSQNLRLYYKKISVKTTNRKNIQPKTYFGLLRISVRQSSSLVRKIAGWTEGIVKGVTE